MCQSDTVSGMFPPLPTLPFPSPLLPTEQRSGVEVLQEATNILRRAGVSDSPIKSASRTLSSAARGNTVGSSSTVPVGVVTAALGRSKDPSLVELGQHRVITSARRGNSLAVGAPLYTAPDAAGVLKVRR